MWYLNESNYTLQSFKINGSDMRSRVSVSLLEQNDQQVLTLSVNSGDVLAQSNFEISLTSFNNPLQFASDHGLLIRTYDNLGG